MSAFLRWTLRGGFSRLVVWPVNASSAPTGESLQTGVIAPVGFAEEPETRVVDDGTLEDLTVTRAAAVEVSAHDAVLALRRWRASDLRVRAVLVASTRGHHLLWDEEVPVLVRAFSSVLSGDRLVLHTERFAANVDATPDLLGTDLGDAGPAWPGQATRVLPAPGLQLYASGVGVRVEALDAGGAVIEQTSQAALVGLRLPDGTFSVRVTAQARPDGLFTKLLRGAPRIATGAGGTVLTSADGTPLSY